MATVLELENLHLELLDVGHQIDSIKLKIKRMQRELENVTVERYHLIPLMQKQINDKEKTLAAKLNEQSYLLDQKQKLKCTLTTK